MSRNSSDATFGWRTAVGGWTLALDDHDALDPHSAVSGYWRRMLSALPDQLNLPFDRPRPVDPSHRIDWVAISVPADTHRLMSSWALAGEVSLFTFVRTALAALLARLSDSVDIPMGARACGSGQQAMSLYRTDVAAAEPFSALLVREGRHEMDVLTHAGASFEWLVDLHGASGPHDRHPLFQIGLTFGPAVAASTSDQMYPPLDLHFIFEQGPDSGSRTPIPLHGRLEYSVDLFDTVTADTIARRVVHLLAVIVADPETPVGELDVLLPAEHDELIVRRNATARDFEVDPTLAELLDAACALDPGAIALIADAAGAGRIEMSYRALGAAVNRLARFLIAQGIGPETLCAVAFVRSIDLVVAQYAIVVAGGTYVPIDPDAPRSHTEEVLSCAQPRCVLTNTETGFYTDRAPTIRIDDLSLSHLAIGSVDDTERITTLRPSNSVYAVFTSGSTGRPKGVLVSHAAVVNHLRWKTAEFGIDADDTIISKAAATFDLSVWEFWAVTISGGCLVLCAPRGQRDPQYLDALIADYRVSLLHVVPSLLDALLSAGFTHAPARVFTVGEALTSSLAQRFLEQCPDSEFFNVYGPTETTVIVTLHRVRGSERSVVSIGAPTWNCYVYVLDSRMHPAPVGVTGELYIAGTQLARGYLRRPDLTCERFVANPFSPGARMYRTGDLAAWNADGELDFRGRADFQVKIRGFRVEPAEVEAALTALPAVTGAVVIATSNTHAPRLIAYVTLDPLAGATGRSVRTSLSGIVPAYMVPARFVILEALPLNANGKIDRSALPDAERATDP